jgi:hypothetical protein
MRGELLTDAEGTTYFMFHCPGCDENHGPVVKRTDAPRPLWGWNGSMEVPTFTPSILVRGTRRITDDEHARIMAGEQLEIPGFVCHSFVTDGRIQFLGDCTHALAGQTVEIPEWES